MRCKKKYKSMIAKMAKKSKKSITGIKTLSKEMRLGKW